MLDKRQIIILAAFSFPLLGLISLSYTESRPSRIPGLAGAPPVSTPPADPLPGQAGSLPEERDRIKKLLDEAMAMTPQQYLEQQKTDRTFLAPTLDVRRERLSKRLAQLNQMLPEQWNEEELFDVDNLPKPKTGGVTPIPGQPSIPVLPKNGKP